ncbi:hypothetical protein B0T14DRAFT_243096 [Immersiella caudata]|uniref:Uncharacterized protein n=1 Tax=Immersiella caudata TaxID=314043 RepID=A0AA39WIZ0_9PEZI|nr:hypothetical protein B0T14DRAFT_243096 [Immersiella caudata]
MDGPRSAANRPVGWPLKARQPAAIACHLPSARSLPSLVPAPAELTVHLILPVLLARPAVCLPHSVCLLLTVGLPSTSPAPRISSFSFLHSATTHDHRHPSRSVCLQKGHTDDKSSWRRLTAVAQPSRRRLSPGRRIASLPNKEARRGCAPSDPPSTSRRKGVCCQSFQPPIDASNSTRFVFETADTAEFYTRREAASKKGSKAFGP